MALLFVLRRTPLSLFELDRISLYALSGRPFFGFDPSKENLVDLMEADWTKKFNRVFRPGDNPRMKSLYNDLRDFKERFRNTLGHGGHGKKGSSIMVN